MIIKIGDESNFNSLVLKELGIVVVDFFASWCAPCRVLSPTIDKLSEDPSIKVYKIDIDDLPDVAHNLDIMSIPTIVIFKDGKECDRKTGVYTIDIIKSWIDSFKG